MGREYVISNIPHTGGMHTVVMILIDARGKVCWYISFNFWANKSGEGGGDNQAVGGGRGGVAALGLPPPPPLPQHRHCKQIL